MKIRFDGIARLPELGMGGGRTVAPPDLIAKIIPTRIQSSPTVALQRSRRLPSR